MLSLSEQRHFKKLLQRLPYPLPMDLFYTIARTFPMVAVETVVWRLPRVRGGVEVLLLRRSPRDPFWPNLWHVPGSILRNREQFEDVFKRLERECGVRFAKKPEFAMPFNFHTQRGHVVSLLFCANIAGRPKRGSFFSVSKLPRDIVREHPKVIRAAARFVRLGGKTPKL